MGKDIEVCIRGEDNIKYVRNFISQYLQQEIGDNHHYFEVAFNEAVNNAIIHGCKNSESKKIWITAGKIGDSKIVIRVKDEGIGFNVDKVLNKIDNYNNDIEEDMKLGEHGRGIFLMKKTADIVKYNKKGNEVMLVKILKGEV